MNAGGIFPAILGTLYLVFGAVAFAVPLGVLSAIYLVEYSRDNAISRLIKLAIVNLAGVPSVVYGLFGLGIFVIFFGFGVSILSGSLTLGIMILPVIITASREALESVPEVLPPGQLLAGGQPVADDPPRRAAARAAGDPDRDDPGPRTRRRRNRAHPVHRGRLLSPDAAGVGVRSDHGPAVSSVRDLHAGAGHPGGLPVRYSTGPASARSPAQSRGDHPALSLPQEEKVVIQCPCI